MAATLQELQAFEASFAPTVTPDRPISHYWTRTVQMGLFGRTAQTAADVRHAAAPVDSAEDFLTELRSAAAAKEPATSGARLVCVRKGLADLLDHLDWD